MTTDSQVNVLITGAGGFIGKNLVVRLRENASFVASFISRDVSETELSEAVAKAQFIVHLAGVNRPQSDKEFVVGNVEFTERLSNIIKKTGCLAPVIFTSSTQAELDNSYGNSKKKAELILRQLEKDTGNPVYIFRLSNVFGKWARPNYNSVVATFCHNVACALPIEIHDPNRELNLVYIDDVIDAFMALMHGVSASLDIPYHIISLGELADKIQSFRKSRESLITEPVGVGFDRALYATYLSYLPVSQFSYPLKTHGDSRGVFVEMLKTQNSGQFSFFTAYPGVTRGGHYHHTKTEKFLVLKGKAIFRFRHIVTDQIYEMEASEDVFSVVETVPGWSHDITNIGTEELVVMLWANEIFNPNKPDTIAYKVSV